MVWFNEKYGRGAIQSFCDAVSMGYDVEYEAPSDFITIVWKDGDARVARMCFEVRENYWYIPILEVAEPRSGFFKSMLAAAAPWCQEHGIDVVTLVAAEPQTVFERVGFQRTDGLEMAATTRNLEAYAKDAP